MPQVPDTNPDTWRQTILDNEGAAQQQLAALDTRDHRACMQLCYTLLSDPAPEVQRAALLLLDRITDRTRPTAQVKISPTLVPRRSTAEPPS